MPRINATFALPPSPEITRRTVQALTALTVQALGNELERTTVIVRYVPPGQWARGGVQSDLGGIVREIDADSWQFLLRMEECSSPTS